MGSSIEERAALNLRYERDFLGNDLSEKLNSFDGKSMSQEEMLEMQFLVNQYNCMLETASTVSKSLTDEAKQIAQRAQ